MLRGLNGNTYRNISPPVRIHLLIGSSGSVHRQLLCHPLEYPGDEFRHVSSRGVDVGVSISGRRGECVEVSIPSRVMGFVGMKDKGCGE